MSVKPNISRSTKLWRGVMGGGAGLGTAGLIAFAHSTFALKDDVRDLRVEVRVLREQVAQHDWEIRQLRHQRTTSK